MDEAGFYVTLPCNASLSLYPENRISNYRTRLARLINLKGKWEVGLAEIEYPRSWYTITEDDAKIHFREVKNDRKRYFEIINLKSGYYDEVLFVIREINAQLPQHVRLGYDHVKNKVYMTAPPGRSLTFHGKLAIILGVIPEKPLEAANEHTGNERNDNNFTPVYAPHQADINGGFYTMYLYTDVIEYQSVGNAHAPLLRCVHITGSDRELVSVAYDRVHYVSVNKNSIGEICIELKDDRNTEVPFSYGKVVVKLHFRPVKQPIL